MIEPINQLFAGMPVVFGGDRLTRVSEKLAQAFRPGDKLIVVQESGDLLHVPATVDRLSREAVGRAARAFSEMASVSDGQISAFFEAFARKIGDDSVWTAVVDANAADVRSARSRGRSTTRLAVSDKMRIEMTVGLRVWRDASFGRGRVVETIDGPGWKVEQVTAGLGVVGFVFEGRPNVFADATGVLRGGNTVVFRIGSDALGTAQTIVREALDPALRETGLPDGAITLLASAEHAAGWAMFSDTRLSLAVARGSGTAVSQLGSVARQSGIPVSLHGSGGAWIVADETADSDKLASAVYHSLDRKVCNSLNVLCLPRSRASELVAVCLDALWRSGLRRRHGCKLHVAAGSEAVVPGEWFSRRVVARRAEGDVDEPLADLVSLEELGREWEWEETPEITLVVVDDVSEAVDLCNRHSPQFIASLISEDEARHRWFYETVNAPFVGNGFTRWVDGQYALNRPELGLSNWQYGRLLGRGGVLSGDTVYTVRTRLSQTDPEAHR